MIDYEGKPLDELTLEETIEFEKAMLKRVLAASKAQMSGDLINQINLFIDLIRDHKTQISQKALYKQGEKDDGDVLTIGEVDLPPEGCDVDKLLDSYKHIPQVDVDKVLNHYKVKSVEEMLDLYKKK